MATNSKQGENNATAPGPTILVSDEFMKFHQYHKSIKLSSSVAFAGSDKTCLFTSSNKWAIDSGANGTKSHDGQSKYFF